MNESPGFCVNTAAPAQIAAHLRSCDDSFTPPLSERVSIEDYAHKIAAQATRFEVWADGELIALVAAYCNDGEHRVAFITSVSVLPDWQGRGIAAELATRCIDHVRSLGFIRIELEVDERNHAALRLYGKHGFSIESTNGQQVIMYLSMEK